MNSILERIISGELEDPTEEVIKNIEKDMGVNFKQ